MEKIRFNRAGNITYVLVNAKPGKDYEGDYYRASDVDAMLADVRALVEATKPVAQEFSEWIKQEGGCDHTVGICYCGVIKQVEVLEQAVAAVERHF